MLNAIPMHCAFAHWIRKMTSYNSTIIIPTAKNDLVCKK